MNGNHMVDGIIILETFIFMCLKMSSYKLITAEMFGKYSYSQNLQTSTKSNEIKENYKVEDQNNQPENQGARLLNTVSNMLTFLDHAMYWKLIREKSFPTQTEAALANRLKKVIKKIEEEQRMYTKRLHNIYLRKRFEPSKDALQYANEMLQFHWNFSLTNPRYYTMKDMVPLLGQDGTRRCIFNHITTPLKMGQVPYIIVPTKKSAAPVRINENYNKIAERFPPQTQPVNGKMSKTPIQDDVNAEKLALMFGATIVLTSKSLQVLFASTDDCLHASWELPVIVKQVNNENEKPTKIVFIGKPLQPRDTPLVEKMVLFYERALKSSLTHPKHIKAFDLNKGSTIRKNIRSVADTELQNKEETHQLSEEPETLDSLLPTNLEPNDDIDCCSNSSDDSSCLFIDTEHRISENPFVNSNDSSTKDKPTTCSSSNSQTLTNVRDQSSEQSPSKSEDQEMSRRRKSPRLNKQMQKESTSNILETIEELQNQTFVRSRRLFSPEETHEINDIKVDDFIPPTEGHNVRYELWRVGKVNVLVRCSLDGVTYDDDKKAHFHALVPKLEFQADYGGECLTTIECVKQWIRTAIVPDCKLLRVRIDAFNSTVVGIQRLNLNQIVPSNIAFNYARYVCSLSVIMEKLALQPVGCYLMSHKSGEGVFSIKREVNIENADSQVNKDWYDFHSCYTTKCKDDFVTLDAAPCVQIDPNVALFMHEKDERIPATFLPRGNPISKEVRAQLATGTWVPPPKRKRKSGAKSKNYSAGKRRRRT